MVHTFHRRLPGWPSTVRAVVVRSHRALECRRMAISLVLLLLVGIVVVAVVVLAAVAFSDRRRGDDHD